MGLLDIRDIEHRLPHMDARIANLIRASGDPKALRLFAYECAKLTLSRCRSPDPRALHALDVGRRFALQLADGKELEAARADAEEAAVSLIRRSDECEAAVKAGSASTRDGNEASYAAFGATTAYYCTVPEPKMAATMAAFEASYAHGGSLYKQNARRRQAHHDALAALAESILGGTEHTTR